jgi:predicted porin
MRGFNGSTPGQSGRREVVRYDSRTFHGFTFVASWGEDDLWHAAITVKDKIGDFSLAARAGYDTSNDPGMTTSAVSTNSNTGTACGGTQPVETVRGRHRLLS